MNPIELWPAVFAVLGFVVVVPAWLHFSGPMLSDVPITTRWLVRALLPMALLLTIGSWVGRR